MSDGMTERDLRGRFMRAYNLLERSARTFTYDLTIHPESALAEFRIWNDRSFLIVTITCHPTTRGWASPYIRLEVFETDLLLHIQNRVKELSVVSRVYDILQKTWVRGY